MNKKALTEADIRTQIREEVSHRGLVIVRVHLLSAPKIFP